MELSFESLPAKVEELKVMSARLSELMVRAAEGLRSSGICPPIELTRELQSYRDNFQMIRAWVQRQPGATLASPGVLAGSIAELEGDIARKETVDRALGALRYCEGLYHTEGESHPVSQTLQSACRNARELLLNGGAESSATAAAFQNGLHPLWLLWSLVAKSDTLDDTRWSEMLDQVTEAFGRDVGTSIARRKLRLRTETKAFNAQLQSSMN